MADQPSTRRTDFGPLYLPNLIVALVASVGLMIGSIGPWMNFFGAPAPPSPPVPPAPPSPPSP